jgi:hypothetical protein
MNKRRATGKITGEMERLLYELSVDHDLQHGEVLALVHAWLCIHVPEQRELYLDGSSPIFNYGPVKK